MLIRCTVCQWLKGSLVYYYRNRNYNNQDKVLQGAKSILLIFVLTCLIHNGHGDGYISIICCSCQNVHNVSLQMPAGWRNPLHDNHKSGRSIRSMTDHVSIPHPYFLHCVITVIKQSVLSAVYFHILHIDMTTKMRKPLFYIVLVFWRSKCCGCTQSLACAEVT